MMTDASLRIKIPQGFWAGLRELGIAAAEVVRLAGLPPELRDEPAEVTAAQYFAIWQAYADLVGGISEAIIQLSTVFETAYYPPSVLATYHARDYRDALNRMTRYKQLCPPERLRITEEGESCIIELDWHETGQSGPAMLVGITLATLLELGRRGTGQPVAAKLVEFSFPLANLQPLEAYFGCRIQTRAACNRLTLHRRDLDRRFLSYNEELLEILTPALDRSLDERDSGRTMSETVKWIMKRALPGGRPDIDAVARELGMSDRTLQRRLLEEGANFKHLLTQARHEQALKYLADPALDMKEVACLIGYEDQNSFYRAFRSWEGETPSSWRAEHCNARGF
ncbi:AraC-like DNA-binding protein [Paenibacillus phyllosphaerae]|uniref:AraC-like DNA-binding protein n=1 Tax=Paenibacillus phyllosphaerae TaxID=274593 RepID=A0A7W5FPP5_9BACL|nr:AraC family transcriptional regulator [Paenibacillus phyllosphaerae]MBB3112438.1 AraC-like DNA-binding protein [Paenibacillus phyllosphaerae]